MVDRCDSPSECEPRGWPLGRGDRVALARGPTQWPNRRAQAAEKRPVDGKIDNNPGHAPLTVNQRFVVSSSTPGASRNRAMARFLPFLRTIEQQKWFRRHSEWHKVQCMNAKRNMPPSKPTTRRRRLRRSKRTDAERGL